MGRGAHGLQSMRSQSQTRLSRWAQRIAEDRQSGEGRWGGELDRARRLPRETHAWTMRVSLVWKQLGSGTASEADASACYPE